MVGHLPEIWLSLFHWTGIGVFVLWAALIGLFLHDTRNLTHLPAGVGFLVIIVGVIFPFMGGGLLIMAHSALLIPSIILAIGIVSGVLTPLLLFYYTEGNLFVGCGLISIICLIGGDLLALGAWVC